MQFSVNMESVLGAVPQETGLSLLEELRFRTVERWTIAPTEVEGLSKALDAHGLRLAACCPDCFTLNDPSRHEAYRQSILRALPTLAALGCTRLITQVGQDTGVPRAEQHDAIIDGIRLVLPILRENGITLLVEPLNDVRDHVGYYLTSSNEGFDIIRTIDDPHVRLLYDVYHQVHMGEDVRAQIEQNLPLIGHFHIAGNPNRDEHLFGGEYDYRPLLAYLAQSGTEALVGLEFFPSSPDVLPEVLTALRAYA